jgi:hypothetical protein
MSIVVSPILYAQQSPQIPARARVEFLLGNAVKQLRVLQAAT